MTKPLIFISGLVVGEIVGIFTLALCYAARMER